MITMFDMASGDRNVAMTEPTEAAMPATSPRNESVQYAQLRLMTVEEAVELERKQRR